MKTADLEIEKGETFKRRLRWQNPDGSPVTLVGFAARMQVRVSHNSASTLISLTSAAGLTLGGAAGTIDVLISAAVTAALPATDGVWDIEVESAGGEVTRLAKGLVKISPEATR